MTSPSPRPSPEPSPGPRSGRSGPSSGRRAPAPSSGAAAAPPASGSSATLSPGPTPIPAPTPTPSPAPPGGVAPGLADLPSQSPNGAPDPDTTRAVQTALGTEHAAIWCYGLIAAFVPAPVDREVREDLAAHRARRDTTIRLLADSGVRPAPAEPAYRLPGPVTDQASATRLAVTAEADAAAAWRSLLERCDDAGLRAIALDGLTDAAVRGARWSARLDPPTPPPAFPGQS